MSPTPSLSPCSPIYYCSVTSHSSRLRYNKSNNNRAFVNQSGVMKSTRPECDMFCHSMTVSVLCITGRRHSTTFRLAFYSNAGCYYIREAMFMLFILFYFLFLHIFFLMFSSFPWRRRRPYRILRGSIGRACLARATMHVTVCHENIMDRLHIAPRIGHPCTCSIYNVWYYFLYISYRHICLCIQISASSTWQFSCC